MKTTTVRDRIDVDRLLQTVDGDEPPVLREVIANAVPVATSLEIA